MEYLDLIIRIVIIGLAVWAIRWGLAQQIKYIKQSIPELPDCAGKHDEIKKDYEEEIERMKGLLETNLNHVAELIEKDLEHGQEKFQEHGKAIEEVKTMIGHMQVSLATIAKNGQRQNERPL